MSRSGGVKLAILGNAIDLMVADPALDVETTLVQGLKRPWPEEPFVAFKKKLGRPFPGLPGDNSGEIIFDKLLLEIIQRPSSRRCSLWSQACPR